MSRFNEMLTALKAIKESIYDWEEGLPEDIYNEYFASENAYNVVAENLKIDKHRWYEVTTTVLAIEGGFLGIRGVTGLFSESMDYEDCGVNLEFFAMEEMKVVSYKPV